MVPAKRVALLGDAFVDVQVAGVTALPVYGTDVSCSSVRLLPGGSCGNTARQLGSLGSGQLDISFFSCIGGDEVGQHYLHALEAEGILCDLRSTLCVIDGAAQSSCVVLSGPSDRAMCSCYETVHRVKVELFTGALFSEPPWALLHIGGYFNCIGLHTDEMVRVTSSLRARGTLISMVSPHPHPHPEGLGQSTSMRMRMIRRDVPAHGVGPRARACPQCARPPSPLRLR